MRDQDPNKVHNAEDLKLTDAGRKVYSGGGIEPDRRFDGPIEGFNPTRFGRTINARNIFDVYAQRFTRKGDTRIAQAPTASPRELSPGFEVTDAMVGEFRELVEKSKIKFDEADWQKDLPFIRAMIRYEIDLDLFGVEAARKDLVKTDPQLQFAVTLFPEAQRLLDMTKISGTQRAAR
jgi:carboxyl-terminal processing protease